MKRQILLLALSLAAPGSCLAGSLTLPQNVIMRCDHTLLSIKAGTVVEVVSKDATTTTIRYQNQVGTIPTSSLAVPPAGAAAAATFSGKRPAITIGPLTLLQAYAPADSPVQLREYIPADETLAHWDHLASIRVFKDLTDPTAYLNTTADAVAKSNPSAQSRFLQNSQTKQVILDFLTFAPANSPQQFAEWNLMRTKFVPGKGLIVYQYATRYYTGGADVGAKISAERNRILPPFETATFEEH